MFNKFLHDKLEKSTNYQKQSEIDSEKLKIKQQIKNKLYSQSYLKKVQEFCEEIFFKPYPIAKIQKPHKFREEEQSKFLASPSIRINGFKNQNERVQYQLELNNASSFNHTPLDQNFRHRSIKKEIFANMKFNFPQRVEQVTNELNNSILYNFGQPNLGKKNKEYFFDKNKKKDAKPNLIIQKNLLPELHKKTHFQASQCIQSELPLFCWRKNKVRLRNQDKNQNGDNKDEISNIHTEENSMRVHEALINCNFIIEKARNTSFLKKSEGRSISTMKNEIPNTSRNLNYRIF